MLKKQRRNHSYAVFHAISFGLAVAVQQRHCFGQLLQLHHGVPSGDAILLRIFGRHDEGKGIFGGNTDAVDARFLGSGGITVLLVIDTTKGRLLFQLGEQRFTLCPWSLYSTETTTLA